MRDLKVFISYSHADEALARSVCDAFASMPGVVPFFSSDLRFGIPGGSAWFAAILKTLRRVDGLVLVATPSSVIEPWPLFEVGAAIGRGKPAVSLMVGMTPDQLPGPLGSLQAVSFQASEDILRQRFADAIGAQVADVWTPGTEVCLQRFLADARTYAGPPSTAKVVVEAHAMHVVTPGISLHDVPKAIVLNVVNHNDYPVRLSAVCLQLPQKTSDGPPRGLALKRGMPAAVPAHDSKSFEFDSADLIASGALDLALTPLVSLTTGETVRGASTMLAKSFLDESPWLEEPHPTKAGDE